MRPPGRGGADPCHKRIDRNSGAKLMAVQMRGAG